MLRYKGVVINKVNFELPSSVNHVQERISQSYIGYRLILVSLRESTVISLSIFNLMKGYFPICKDSSPKIIHNCLFYCPKIVPLTDEVNKL